jgi:hypothetical protein
MIDTHYFTLVVFPVYVYRCFWQTTLHFVRVSVILATANRFGPRHGRFCECNTLPTLPESLDGTRAESL